MRSANKPESAGTPEAKCAPTSAVRTVGQEPTFPTGWVQRVESQAVSSWNTGRVSRE